MVLAALALPPAASRDCAPKQATLCCTLWTLSDLKTTGWFVAKPSTWLASAHDRGRVTRKPEVETAGRGGAKMNLPGETEAGIAGTQPCRGIARWAHRDDEQGAEVSLPRSSRNLIGSVDPDALKIPARRAEYSLTESALSPFQAEPTHAAQNAIPSRDRVPGALWAALWEGRGAVIPNWHRYFLTDATEYLRNRDGGTPSASRSTSETGTELHPAR